MENTIKTSKDILFEKGKFVAYGTVLDISGTPNKVYPSKFEGSQGVVSLSVNGKRQNVRLFGGVGKDTPIIKVFIKGADGKVVRDGNNKTITKQIKPSEFDENQHLFFERKEVFYWGDKVDGKASKMSVIDALTDGAFVNELINKKDSLIGKRVRVEGEAKYKLSQKKDKIEIEMSVSRIILQAVEEGKTYNEFFTVETPMIMGINNITETIKDGILYGYVPMYIKYKAPIMVDGKERKGRVVYTPMNFSVEENGFLGIAQELGFTIEERAEILQDKLTTFSDGMQFIAGKFLLSNKSGMVERTITFEDLLEDPRAKSYVKKIDGITDEAELEAVKEKIVKAYGRINPATVQSEFIQKVSFINIMQDMETARDICAGVDISQYEIKSLADIAQELNELEAIKNTGKTTTATTPTNVTTVKTNVTSSIPEPAGFTGSTVELPVDDKFPF